MTQVDLEALASVCGVGDRKIACEPLSDDSQAQAIPESTVLDYAPESFWLSKDAEFDWFDRNAFLERKESIKGNSNSMNLNPVVNPSHAKANTCSLQISAFLKSKAAQKTNYVDSKRRNCRLTNILLFPKRSDSIGKEPAVLSMAEPSSPKVSCLGKVRSKRCPRRRKSNRPVSVPENPVTRREKTGFISCIKSLLQFDCRRSNKSLPELSAPRRKNVTYNPFNNEHEATVDPPALGRLTH